MEEVYVVIHSHFNWVTGEATFKKAKDFKDHYVTIDLAKDAIKESKSIGNFAILPIFVKQE